MTDWVAMDPLVAMGRARAMKGEPKSYWNCGTSFIPRRFRPLVLILIVVSYGALLTWLTFDGFNWIAFGEASSFFAAVGIAQLLLYEGKKPRKAAILVGTGFGIVFAAVVFLPWVTLDSRFAFATLLSNFLHFDVGQTGSEWFNLITVSTLHVVVLSMLGYVVGCFIATTFMSMRWIRSMLEAFDMILPEWASQQKREILTPRTPEADSNVLD